MKVAEYTNVANLPKEIVNAILKDRYTVEEEEAYDYSATTLIAPVRITVLKKRYPDKLVIRDVLDYFWMFLGSVAHQCLEEAWHESMGSVVEERLYADIDGTIISGKVDCYGDHELRDYKFTKSYKIIKGDVTDWAHQLNIYRYLCAKNNQEVNRLTVYAFILDWNKHDLYKKNYPEHKIHRIDLPVFPLNEVEAFIRKRVQLLNEAMKLPDEALPECTPREMWQDVKDYAIMKKNGTARAYRTFDTETEANEFFINLKNKTEYYLTKRLTPRTRCLYHCPVSSVCEQHKRLLALENPDLDSDVDPLF